MKRALHRCLGGMVHAECRVGSNAGLLRRRSNMSVSFVWLSVTILMMVILLSCTCQGCPVERCPFYEEDCQMCQRCTECITLCAERGVSSCKLCMDTKQKQHLHSVVRSHCCMSLKLVLGSISTRLYTAANSVTFHCPSSVRMRVGF